METNGGSSGSDPQASVFGKLQKGFDKLQARAYELLPQQQHEAQRTEPDVEAAVTVNSDPIGKDWSEWSSSIRKQAEKMQKGAKKHASNLQKEMSKQVEKAKEGYQKVDLPQWNSVELSKMFDRDALQNSTAGQVASKSKDAILQAGSKTKEGLALAGAKTKEAASSAASSTKASLAKAKESVDTVVMSRDKLMQFLGVFLVGTFMISLSLSYIPLIVIQPQKFALLFAFGSSLMMGSFTIVKGPKDLWAHMTERSKLPFSAGYALGMVGVLWASLFRPSFAYVWIILFSTLQVVALSYFLVSYIPGGKRALTFVGRNCIKGFQKLCSL